MHFQTLCTNSFKCHNLYMPSIHTLHGNASCLTYLYPPIFLFVYYFFLSMLLCIVVKVIFKIFANKIWAHMQFRQKKKKVSNWSLWRVGVMRCSAAFYFFILIISIIFYVNNNFGCNCPIASLFFFFLNIHSVVYIHSIIVTLNYNNIIIYAACQNMAFWLRHNIYRKIINALNDDNNKNIWFYQIIINVAAHLVLVSRASNIVMYAISLLLCIVLIHMLWLLKLLLELECVSFAKWVKV